MVHGVYILLKSLDTVCAKCRSFLTDINELEDYEITFGQTIDLTKL